MKIGDYVRTKDGLVGKIINVEYSTPCNTKHGYICKIDATDETWFEEDDIKLEKEGLIKLVEVGDYVNGYKVISLWKDKTKVIGVAVDGSVIGFDECEIKSIVTKEQFESMEYRIGE